MNVLEANKRINDLCEQVRKLKSENESLRICVADLQWMARRYANGCTSYAPYVMNERTAALVRLGVKLNPCGEQQIFSRDGMDGQPDAKGGGTYYSLSEQYLACERLYIEGKPDEAKQALGVLP